MPSPTWIRIVIALVALAMLGIATLTGDSVDEKGLRWITGVAGGITVLLLVFDRWVWRWPGIRWLVELSGSRVIHGTWRGTLRYVADGDGQPGEQPIFMAVHQTYSLVKIRCYFPTKRSESWSLVASIERDSHRHVVRYIYQQMAEVQDRDHNRPTEGVCALALVGRPVEEIAGTYYAERGGKGTIEFDGFCMKVAGSGAQAERMRYRELPRDPAR